MLKHNALVARQMQLCHVRWVLLTAQDTNAATISLGERQKRVLKVVPRGARSREIGEEPKHGQVSLDVIVKVFVGDDTLERSSGLINNVTKRANSERAKESQVTWLRYIQQREKKGGNQ